jgi:N-sulfoglucosamine sulfohydrolase
VRGFHLVVNGKLSVRNGLAGRPALFERFDREVGELLDMLEKSGQLDNTIVVMTSDNGAPFPRAKTNLYDIGTRMPTAVMWRARAKGGRRVEDFVSHTDWAPTFLEAAGLKPPADMTGRSIVPIMTGAGEGRVDPLRDAVFTGRERHTNLSAGHVGYPMRAIRTHDYLYVRNFKPERWPAGDPEQFGDIDGGPTKTYLLEKRTESAVAPLFALSCGKRPAEELYDCRTDPEQLKNLAADPAHGEARKRLADRLMAYLKETRDPRALGSGDAFDTYPYVSG